MQAPMMLISAMTRRPIWLFFILVLIIPLIPTLVTVNWWFTTIRVETAAKSASQYVHRAAFTYVRSVIKSLYPANDSALNLARLLNSTLNVTRMPLSSTSTSMVSSHLFLAFKTLRLSQISYIGLNGSITSYYMEGNQTVFLSSNGTSTNTTSLLSSMEIMNNTSLVYNCSSQQVDSGAGKPFDNRKNNSTVLIDISWLQRALLNSFRGYASLGTGWGTSQEQLFLNSVAINGLGVVSLGFPVKAINDTIPGMDLSGADLYLFSKEGTNLAQTGPHRVNFSNNSISVTVTNSSDSLPAPPTIDIMCDPSNEPLRRKNIDIRGAKYLVYCEQLDIAGIPSVLVMFYPHRGLVPLVQRHTKTALVLFLVLLVFLVMTVSSFVYIIIGTVRREMFFCAALIKQTEATQQAERKSMNKSLAFASASHDIRSSLAALDGLVTLCSKEVAPNSEVYVNLEQMKTSTNDLVGLLNSVLDTSKIEAGKMQLTQQEFYLAQVLEESVNLYYPVGKEKGIDLVLDPCDGSVFKHPLVKGDRGKLKQILNNLLHNAIKFTSHGHVSVCSWVQKSSPEGLMLHSKNTSPWNYFPLSCFKNIETYSDSSSEHHKKFVEFVIEVDDSGKGIAKEKQKSVFEDFVQVKDTALEQGGTGLGLGIVQSLVRLMGGDIQIIDKDLGERGTCFQFNIVLSICETSSSTPDRIIPMDLNHIMEVNTRTPSLRPEGSHILLFLQGGERRKILQKFFQTLGLKVSIVDHVQHLLPALEKIKRRWNLAHLSSSAKSDSNSFSDSLSSPASHKSRRKDMSLNLKDGTEYPLPFHKKASSKGTLCFALIIIDFSDANFMDVQFSELQMILESFKKDVSETRCKVVWLYSPKTNTKARKLEERKLSKCELIVSKPLHGARLYQLLTLLPEFGGATTIQGHRPSFAEETVKSSSLETPKSQAVEGGRTPRGDKLLGGKRVLVVEDTMILRKVATKILEQHGAVVECCENGEEAVKQVCDALSKIAKRSTRLPYEFIFMDCEMPVMNGYEATRQIRLEEKAYQIHFPIIALTAHAETEVQSKIRLAGMDAFITKPLNQEKLYMAIKSLER